MLEVSNGSHSQKEVVPGLEAFTDRLNLHDLTGRDTLFDSNAGCRVYRAINRKLRRLPGGSVLLVDLTRLREASYGSLKEVLSAVDLLREAKHHEKYLVFCIDQRNHDLIESIEMIARSRGHLIPVIGRNGDWHNLGKLTKAERDTLELVEKYGALTSKELHKRFGLLLSAASNRLRRLHHLRLIKREERVVPTSGGREFVYKPLVSLKRRTHATIT
ncbi:MAG TPA: hypothetical protein VM911_14550 [Pyrinomonadaceae bacterium]|nr:hypothetical protein [Pyrinomonadaceae bacterium]